MTEPTPRPWHVPHIDGMPKDFEDEFDLYGDWSSGPDAKHIAFINSTVADARLIVTAVNCHDELVAICESAHDASHLDDELRDRMRTILAKIREQESQG